MYYDPMGPFLHGSLHEVEGVVTRRRVYKNAATPSSLSPFFERRRRAGMVAPWILCRRFFSSLSSVSLALTLNLSVSRVRHGARVVAAKIQGGLSLSSEGRASSARNVVGDRHILRRPRGIGQKDLLHPIHQISQRYVLSERL